MRVRGLVRPDDLGDDCAHHSAVAGVNGEEHKDDSADAQIEETVPDRG